VTILVSVVVLVRIGKSCRTAHEAVVMFSDRGTVSDAESREFKGTVAFLRFVWIAPSSLYSTKYVDFEGLS
jgi:hypothetical protein